MVNSLTGAQAPTERTSPLRFILRPTIGHRIGASMLAISTIAMPVSQLAAETAAWKGDLQREIERTYRPTRKNLLGRATAEGTVLVIRKDGIRGDAPKMMVTPTEVRDGQIVKQGGGGLLSGGRSFTPGERVLLTRVDIKDESVRLFIETAETTDVIVSEKNIWGKKKPGETKQTTYIACISFAFPPGALETSAPADVLNAIRTVLVPEQEAAAVVTKTIQLGQTGDEVMRILGKPDKEVQLGPKTVLVYKDMKVILQDGKVADVQ